MKVKLFSHKLNKLYGIAISWISTISSILLILIDIPKKYKNNIGIFICYVIVLALIYIIVWIYANKKKKVKLTINNVTVFINEGDIFQQNGLKIIPFNEYFDTIVDDKLISRNSLNGVYIKEHVHDVKKLDAAIRNDKRLRNLCTVIDEKRISGKKLKYPLGSIYKDDDYLLLAFSKFDKDNRAYLDKSNFLECLLNMWNEIDICYSTYDVYIPLLGSGITRFQGINLTEQELLELLLISLRLSNIKFKANISIIINESKIEDINFFKLSDFLE